MDEQSGSSSRSLLGRLFSGRRGNGDAGGGSLDDYAFDLLPKSKSTAVRLADSDTRQDELRAVLESGADEVWAMIGRRTSEEERTDAPMPVRVMAAGRVSPVVGIVPRGLEAPIDVAIGRLLDAGKAPRIPATIVTVKGRLRLDLLIGATR